MNDEKPMGQVIQIVDLRRHPPVTLNTIVGVAAPEPAPAWKALASDCEEQCSCGRRPWTGLWRRSAA